MGFTGSTVLLKGHTVFGHRRCFGRRIVSVATPGTSQADGIVLFTLFTRHFLAPLLRILRPSAWKNETQASR